MSRFLIADGFIEIVKTTPVLQSLVDSVHNYSKHGQFEANVKECAVAVFFPENKKSCGQVGLE